VRRGADPMMGHRCCPCTECRVVRQCLTHRQGAKMRVVLMVLIGCSAGGDLGTGSGGEGNGAELTAGGPGGEPLLVRGMPADSCSPFLPLDEMDHKPSLPLPSSSWSPPLHMEQ
jgi:hypothetical protein